MNIQQLAQIPLAELQRGYQTKDISPVEVVRLSLAQIEAVNNTTHALYGIRADEAMVEAREAEARYAKGNPASAFDGVPVTIKDSVHAVGMVWYHGSNMYGRGVVGTKDSPPARRLKQAGAIILGKGAMPDFGMSGSGVSGSHGIVRNPWGLAWNTGGSSAGGGASLASGIGMLSVGSDIAGSVRLPAAHCGLAALKPTQGVIPHTPASTVRSAGVMCRQAGDMLAWTRLLSGPDKWDRYSLPLPERRSGAVSGLHVGVSADFGFGPVVEPAVMNCLDNAKTALGNIVGTVAEIDANFGFDAYIPIDDSFKLRAWREYAAADPQLQDQAPGELCDWFKEASHWSGDRINQFEIGIERGANHCVELLSDVDFLLTPVMPAVNFPAEDRGIDLAMPLRHTTFTAPFNQSGQPAITICGGFDERGLPIGVQLVGNRFDDVRLLALATALEAQLDIFGTGKKSWPIVPVA